MLVSNYNISILLICQSSWNDFILETSRYDILFEPVTIGPVTAKNRFYQVPHCTGLGWLRPRMVAELRSVKAQGGWGVVCTEYSSIHSSSDDMPFASHALWDETDIKSNALMTQKVHEHGALAGVELWHGGARASNLHSREIGLDVASLANYVGHPWQTRRMDKSDISNLRAWHRQAAKRAMQADFDIVYIYATHDYLLSHFLSAQTNQRNDEYGGSLVNRTRLIRELIEETKDAVGHRCAVAVRFSIDGVDGEAAGNEARDMFEILCELPDLWDINIGDYNREMGVSRFVKEASLETHMSFVKSVTSKPVVTVGRFTSPDTMVSQVKRGIVDFIGAARPSIADPYLPNKIFAGNYDEIRECIGCNICYSSDSLSVPIRCTQNPTMGEEWRRGWHPETIAPKTSDATILVVGAGPAGLESARALGLRGYQVLLAEKSSEAGGRVTLESKLPGLSEWSRVRDYRLQTLSKMTNVELYLESDLGVNDIVEINPDHVLIATGAKWRHDGVGQGQCRPIEDLQPGSQIYTPDDIMAGRLPTGKTVIYDTDGYYMASVIAQLLAQKNNEVVYLTPEDKVSPWSAYTDEQYQVQKQLLLLGVDVQTSKSLVSFKGQRLELSCSYTQKQSLLTADSLVLVTTRQANDNLYYDLINHLENFPLQKTIGVTRIGDCDAPNIIAEAVFAGHKFAREFDLIPAEVKAFKVDKVFYDQ